MRHPGLAGCRTRVLRVGGRSLPETAGSCPPTPTGGVTNDEVARTELAQPLCLTGGAGPGYTLADNASTVPASAVECEPENPFLEPPAECVHAPAGALGEFHRRVVVAGNPDGVTRHEYRDIDGFGGARDDDRPLDTVVERHPSVVPHTLPDGAVGA